jgi:hypothetical protein
LPRDVKMRAAPSESRRVSDFAVSGKQKCFGMAPRSAQDLSKSDQPVEQPGAGARIQLDGIVREANCVGLRSEAVADRERDRTAGLGCGAGYALDREKGPDEVAESLRCCFGFFARREESQPA